MFYLTQTAKFREFPIPDLPSFDDTFKMDYMGSAEFEFGALPKSLHRICDRLDDYIIYAFVRHANYKVDYVYAICRGDQLKEIDDGIEILKRESWPREIQFKENIHFHDTFNDRAEDRHVDLWWEIENDFFFCIGPESAEALMEALRNTRTKFQNSED